VGKYCELPAELALVCKLSSPSHFGTNGLDSYTLCETDSIDWKIFLEFCTIHRLYPLVYTNAREKYSTIIPKAVMAELKQLYIVNSFQMDILSGELVRIIHACSEDGIGVLAYKGPALAQVLYGDISLRVSKDLDVLIHPTDFPKVHSLMISWGYSVTTPYENANLHSIIDSDSQHHIEYIHPLKMARVEIHWRLFEAYEKPYVFDAFQNYTNNHATIFLQGFPIPIFSPTLQFITLCFHGSKHMWNRMRWLVDISMILHNPATLDWSQILQIAKESDLLPILGQTTILLAKIFNFSPPQELRPLMDIPKAIRLAQMVLRKYSIISNPEADHYFSLSVRLDRKYRTLIYETRKSKSKQFKLFLVRLIRPSKSDFEMIRLPRIMFPLYFILRPILIIIRMVRKVKISSQKG